MTVEDCERCKYWKLEITHETKELTQGLCRRLPPQRDTFDEIEIEDLRGHWWTGWLQPMTTADSWCGEFKATHKTPHAG